MFYWSNIYSIICYWTIDSSL